MKNQTVFQVLKSQSERSPDATAIIAPRRRPLTYRNLLQQIQTTGEQLNKMGIGQGDRVALVLPNGPEMALAFLSVVSAATVAPLNPNYRASEFDFYLSDLDVRMLVVMQGMESPAREVAAQRGIAIAELLPVGEGLEGQFAFSGSGLGHQVQGRPAEEDDIAMLLHTSGTTSRPKQVPLTHRNLCASMTHICQSLALTQADCCLNMMPLFHVHGLMAALLSSLAAGGKVVCTPGFHAPSFFEWLDEFKPTWYTAVPTMHQAILGRVHGNRDVIKRSPLRFIRSCSASLPPQVMAEMEQAFHAPVVEAYGMTEASHQISCNPLPPLKRKAGSVGTPSGVEIAIMAEDREMILAQGAQGEIVLRGPNVTSGYASNPEANARSFTSRGWFRTGDQGYLDEEGYLFITGRLKELINRGGEKISPREVEEILLDHPAVTQAVAFAMQDAALGEEVAAAVVVNDPSVDERMLRQYASLRLVDFKVPRRILILDEIPKGPTGKPQRIGLAEKLGLSGQLELVTAGRIEPLSPRTSAEKMLAALWCEVLHVPEVGVNIPFLDAGGDSVLAAQLVARLAQKLDMKMTLIDFFDMPTVEQQAAWIEKRLLEEMDSSVD